MDRAWIFAPLVLVNLWHAILITRFGRADSISKSALVHRSLMVIHRVAHCFGAGCFIVYAVLLANDPSFYLSAVVLVSAAIFDIIQALVLSSTTDHALLKLSDGHQLTAWIMAALYLLFSLIFAFTVGLNFVIVVGLVLCLVLAAGLYTAKKFRNLAYVQMLFFLCVSVMIALSALRIDTL